MATGTTSSTKEYYIWIRIRKACNIPTYKDYPRYGGRGIKVCDRWCNNFEAFLKDIGLAPSPNHSIDRIDNNGHYEPNNCRWATPKEQANNRRNNKRITWNEETHTLSEWATILNIPRKTLEKRLNKHGWTVERAMTTPVRKWIRHV